MNFNQNPSIENNYPQIPNPKLYRYSSKIRWLILIVFLFLSLIASFRLGYVMGKKGFVYEPKEFKVINQNEAPKVVDYQLLWDAIRVVNEKFIEKPATPEQILYGAVRGAVESFKDPYTTFFEPQNLETFKTDLAGSFEGIGAEIGKRDGQIVIIAPLDDMPAQKAGVMAKDIILEVDGQSTEGWSVEEAVSKIRGKKGTKVTLKLFREGRITPFDVTIERDKIEIKSVKWEFKEVERNGRTKNLAIIRLIKFGDDTLGLLQKAVNEILLKDVDGIILDLRNNPGGYLQTAADVASYWVEGGRLIVKEEVKDHSGNEFRANGQNRLKNYKTVVLINGGSASAAEILAGALQDYGLARLIGEKSFGKGSVQQLVDLRGGTAVKVTVARWITPGGKNLNKQGLTPDLEVKMTEEDYKQDKDPQMDAALREIVDSK